MLIIPVTLILSLMFMKRNTGFSLSRAIPWFIVWFVVASLLNSHLPKILTQLTYGVSTVLITTALIAIGLSTDVRKMKHTGWRPVMLGLLVWAMVASSSLLLQYWGGFW